MEDLERKTRPLDVIGGTRNAREGINMSESLQKYTVIILLTICITLTTLVPLVLAFQPHIYAVQKGNIRQPQSVSGHEAVILQIKKKYESSFLAFPNVVGVGVGLSGDEYCIRIYSKNKTEALSLVPFELEGYLVEIVETDGFYAFQDSQHHGKWRPLHGGISIGQPYWGTGTMGVTVYGRSSETMFTLSNNHVLARGNSDRTHWGKVGDEIIQPGHADGGRGSLDAGIEVVASLYSWVEIRTGDITRPLEENPDNYVDCALAQVDNPSLCNNEIMEIGLVSQIVNAELGMNVKKSGRTTGLTHGVIRDISFTGWVGYHTYSAKFVDQIMVEPTGQDPFSLPGDSGSLVVDSSNQAVGLLFAGNAKTGVAICNPINLVLDALDVDLPQTHDTVVPELIEIVPVGWFDVGTQPVEGDIYMDAIWIGRGYTKGFVEIGSHEFSFGFVEGYETPSPITRMLIEKYPQSLRVIYHPLDGTFGQLPFVILIGVAIILGFWFVRRKPN